MRLNASCTVLAQCTMRAVVGRGGSSAHIPTPTIARGALAATGAAA
jgi:hypothetical protein